MTLVPGLPMTQARRLLTNSVKMRRAKQNTALTMGETFVRVRSLDQRVDNLITSSNYTESVFKAVFRPPGVVGTYQQTLNGSF